MRMRFPTSLSLALTAALTLTSAACGKKEDPKPTQAPATSAAPTTPASADAGEAEQPRREPESVAAAPDAGPTTPPPSNDAVAPAAAGIFAAPALAHLPKTTFGLLVGTPQKVIDGLGLDKLMATYAAELKPFIERMQSETGKNFFDPQTFKDMGVDLAGPAGVAGIDAEREAMVIFATLADPAALRKSMEELAAKAGVKFTEDKAGTATILSIGTDDRGAFSIDGNQLMVVVYGRGSGAVATAKELATLTADAGLASTNEFRNAVKDVAADEAGAFLNLQTVMQLVTMRKKSEVATDMLQKSLEEAKAAGNQAEVARIESIIADEKRWAEERNKRDAAEQELVKSVFGDLSGLGFGIDLTAESGEASFRLPIGASSMLGKLVKNTTGIFPIVTMTKGEPLFLAAGHIDLPAYLALVDQAMKTEGEDLGEVKSQLKAMTGLDFDKDIIGLFTGDYGIAVTGDMKAVLGSDDPFASISGGVLIGLANPDGMRALMAKLATIEGLARAVRWDADKGTMSIPLPIGDKTLTVQVAGNQLVVTPDPDFATRVAANDASASFVAGLTNSRLKAFFERPNQAGVFAFRQAVSMGWMLMGKHRSARPAFPEPTDAALKAKYDEYMKLQKEVEAEQDAAEAKEREVVGGLFEKLGTFAGSVSVQDGAFVGSIGQYVNGTTVPDLVGELVKLSMMAGHRDDDPVRAKREQMWKLESELMSVKPMEAVPPPAPK